VKNNTPLIESAALMQPDMEDVFIGVGEVIDSWRGCLTGSGGGGCGTEVTQKLL